MKSMILTAVLSIALFANAFATKTINGNSESPNGEYHIAKTTSKVFSIDYSNHIEDFEIEIKKEKGQSFFLVRSSQIEVMYVAGNNGFGLRKMPKKWSTMEVDNSLLNSKAFKYQAKITPSALSNKKCLGLIASFLPEVFNQ